MANDQDNQDKENNKSIPMISAEEAVQDTEYLQNILNVMGDRFEDEFELAQGRSDFQIEKFMGLNEFTPSAQFKHLLKNAMIMRRELFRVIKEGIKAQRIFALKWESEAGLEARKAGLPIEWHNKEGHLEHCWFDLDQFEFEVAQRELAISIKDKVQQLALFDSLLDEIEARNGGKITREQFNNEESVYWERRFSKQIHDDLLSKQTGVNAGNIESARNASAPTIIDGSKNKINNLPSLEVLLRNPQQFLLEAQVKMAEAYNQTTTGQINVDSLKKLADHNNVQQIPEHPAESVNNQVHPTEEKFDLNSLGISTKKE